VPSQPVDVIKHSSRWAGQRWLLDAVIALVGPEWDQGRVAYYAAACGQDSQVDFTAVRPRIRKYDDLARGFSKAARRREVLARDAVHLQGNVSRDGRRSPDRTRLMAERDARQQGISFDEAIAAIADSIPAKRLGRPEEFGAACAFLHSAQAAAGVPPLAQVPGVLVEDAVLLPGSVVDQPGTPPRARKIRGPGGGQPRCERIDGLLNS
jgi:hypothetical protein